VREIVVHVALSETNDAVAEDLDDLETAIDALLAGVVEPPVKVVVRPHVGGTGADWPGYAHHRVHLISDRLRPAGGR